MTWFEGTGVVQYFDGDNGKPHKAWVLIDPDIGSYYRSLIPAWIRTNGQRYPSHISFVRKIKPANLEVWGKHEGKVVSFKYENYLYNDERYWWLNVESPDIERIREELGMPAVGPTTWSPDRRHKFHTTVANMKDL